MIKNETARAGSDPSLTRLLSLLGLCRRAGKLACGAKDTADAIRARRVRLVLLASDASGRTSKMMEDKCAWGRVRLVRICADRAALGAACGIPEMSACGIADEGFSRSVLSLAVSLETAPGDSYSKE